jgi:hypothetical protein
MTTIKPGQRYVHRTNQAVMHIKQHLLEGRYLTTKGVMSADTIQAEYVAQKRVKAVTSIVATKQEVAAAKAKHGSLRKCFLAGLNAKL